MQKKITLATLIVAILTAFTFSSNVFATYQVEQKYVVILVEFNETTLPRPGCNVNYSGSITQDDYYFSNSFFGIGVGDTVRKYFREETNGKLDIKPAEESSGTSNDGIIRVKLDYPNPNIPDISADTLGCVPEARQIMRDALTKADPYINISLFDTNANNELDWRRIEGIENHDLNFLFVIAGASGGPYTRAYTITNPVVPSPILDNVDLFNTNFVWYDSNDTLGTFCHEVAHTFGAADLYPENTRMDVQNVNHESIMYSGEYLQLDPFHKLALNFVAPTIVTSSGIYTVNAMDPNAPNSYNYLKIPNGDTGTTPYFEDYFLVENRQFSGCDSNLQDGIISGGIALWHLGSSNMGGKAYPGDGFIRLELPEDKDLHYYSYSGGEKIRSDRFYFMGGANSDYDFPGGISKINDNTTPGSTKTFTGNNSGISININSQSSQSMNVAIKLLDEPKNVRATTGSSINLTWNQVPVATAYQVCTDNGAYADVGSNLSFVCPDSNNHTYKIRGKRTLQHLGNNAIPYDLTGAISTFKVSNGNCALIGDVNCDGTVTIDDYNLIKAYIVGTATLTQTQILAADVNGSGTINTSDSSAIQKGVVTALLSCTEKILC